MDDECAELRSLLARHNSERAELTKKLRNDKVIKGSDWPDVDMADKNPTVLKFLEPEVLENFLLNDGVSARQEFWIAEKNSKIALYEEPESGGTYMRIHSMDSHAANLAQWAITVSLMVSKQLSMTFVVVELWNSVHSCQLFWVFVIVWSCSLVLWVAGAARQARTTLTLSKGGGDFVTKKGCNVGYMKLFVVMTFLELGCVPREIAESPVTFHIRKMVQPYAVMKKDGKRVWVTGYMHKTQYENDKCRAFLLQAPVLLFKDVIVVGIQCWLGFFHGTFNVALVYAIVSGIAGGLFDISKLYWALKIWNQSMQMLTDRKAKLEQRALEMKSLSLYATMTEDDKAKVKFELHVVEKELSKMRAGKVCCTRAMRQVSYLKKKSRRGTSPREPLLHTL